VARSGGNLKASRVHVEASRAREEGHAVPIARTLRLT
jgi:hypothetical protein